MSGTTIELDYNDERDQYDVTTPEAEARTIVEASVRRFLGEHDLSDVTFTITRVFGPAGGAAVVAFTAPTRERLHDVLAAYEVDPDERAYLLADA